jgi:hypothetical protein
MRRSHLLPFKSNVNRQDTRVAIMSKSGGVLLFFDLLEGLFCCFFEGFFVKKALELQNHAQLLWFFRDDEQVCPNQARF